MAGFRITAGSSRISKPSSTKPAAFKRNPSSFSHPYADLPHRKPSLKHSKSLASSSSTRKQNDEEEEGGRGGAAAADEEDLFNDKLDDVGLVEALAKDLILRDVPQAMMYIRAAMWSPIPEERAGMNGKRIAEVLGFRKAMPQGVVTVSHVQALLRSATRTEREIAELIRKGVMRKVEVSGRGSMSELLVLVADLEQMVEKSALEREVKVEFVEYLRGNPTAMKVPRDAFREEVARELIHKGFLTTSTPNWTTTEVYSKLGDGLRGTMTSIQSISRAASGSLAAVGGSGAVHSAGGTGGGISSLPPGTYSFTIAIPSIGSFLKLLETSKSHLVSLLSKPKYREMPESMLKQKWEGSVEGKDEGSDRRRWRGEFAGVLPGRTRKWKTYWGLAFEWVLEECVGAGMVEVFETGSVGRGVRII